MSADHARPIYVAILGTDAILAARPVDSVQLARACQLAGFDVVVPVSWGEEVIADHLAALNGSGSVVAAICPLAREQLMATPVETPVVQTVPPPVATARYVRAAFHPRQVHVTYVGACPGARHDEVDVHCLPHALFTRLNESGIDAARQPRHLDGQIPAERARYASVPGGAPDCNWLLAHNGRRVVEAAPITVDVVTQVYHSEALLIDLAAACRCVCARDRLAAARLEPPRSMKPVVGDVPISVVSDEGGLAPADAATAPPADDTEAPRAKFAENGLSSGEVAPIASHEHMLTRSVEPW